MFAFVALGVVSLRAAVIVSGVVTIACGLACALPDAGNRLRAAADASGRAALGELRTTAVAGGRYVRAQPLLLLLLGIASHRRHRRARRSTG